MKTKFIKTFLIISSIIFLVIILYPFYLNRINLNQYLKDYSSLILIYLTYIYVLLTYLILHSSNKISQEQMRPYVIANFYQDNYDFYFSIKNYGKRPAINVNVNISDGFDNLQFESIRGNYKYMLKQKFIAPSQEIKNLVADGMSIMRPSKDSNSKLFDIEIVFYDTEFKKYKTNYQIDFNNLFDEKTISLNRLLDETQKIKDELSNIEKAISKLSV